MNAKPTAPATPTQTRKLPCPLNDKALTERRDELAEALATKDAIEANRLAFMEQNTGEKKLATQLISRLAREIRDKKALRDVAVLVERDEDAKRILVTRTDTGEQIENRPMRADELQMPLPDQGNTKKKSKKATADLGDQR